MQRARESFGGNHDARPRNDEFVADEQVHAIVLHGWNGLERIPHAAFGVDPVRFQRIAVVKLENHVRSARQDHLGAHVDRLLVEIAEHIGAAGQFEQVVEEPIAAAGVDVP